MLDRLNIVNIWRAERLIHAEHRTILFVTPLLRAREIKMASALRKIGWKVVLIYIKTTPFSPDDAFDIVIRARNATEAHRHAKTLKPRICHVFSGAVDAVAQKFCGDKPGPVVIDLNDVFCPSLFDYCHERFEPTRECLGQADGLCARDLQATRARRLDGFSLPRHVLFFPEYSCRESPARRKTMPKLEPDEVHIVSVGTFCLESLGMHDSGYLQLSRMLTAQKIHLHIYPNWTYRKRFGSAFNWNLKKHFSDFFELARQTPYLHMHPSLPLEQLAEELPQYDFGIISGGSRALGQRMTIFKPEYMKVCYSGRISDYLDARLPVLINREVVFNDWLLRRYGIAIDLGGVLQPGFKEKLLAHKRDNVLAGNMDRAARVLSLDENAVRLAKFYDDIMSEYPAPGVNLGYSWLIARRLPFVRDLLTRPEAALQSLNQTALELRHELADEREENARKTRMLRDMQARLRPALESTRPSAEQGSTSSVGAPAAYTGIEDAKLHFEIEWGSKRAVNEVSGLLNWPGVTSEPDRANGIFELLEMARIFAAASGTLTSTSSCWNVLNYKNFNQLLSDGYRNFKRTIGCNYFNFLVQKDDPQITFLEHQLTENERARCRETADALPRDPAFEWEDQSSYRYFVLLLWTYAARVDTHHYLERLAEPAEGNPITVPYQGRLATQDLANSVLEYYSMSEAVDFAHCKRVLEIGGGYGRDAYVIMALNPHLQYTLVDIPPALFIAQRYLSSVFKDRRVFRARQFESYEDVRQEMAQASIVFLLPHQLALLPPNHFDLSLNISSFGEMQPHQIQAYLELLEKQTRGYFYMKQWKVSQNAFDKLELTESDYPLSKSWRKIYSRSCRVQTGFFEALYRTGHVST